MQLSTYIAQATAHYNYELQEVDLDGMEEEYLDSVEFGTQYISLVSEWTYNIT